MSVFQNIQRKREKQKISRVINKYNSILEMLLSLDGDIIEIARSSGISTAELEEASRALAEATKNAMITADDLKGGCNNGKQNP